MAASVIPKIEKISSRVIRILGCNPSAFTLQGTNSYLVGTGKRKILVDTSNPGIHEYVHNLQTVLQQHDAEIGEVVLTHWHPDHVGAIADLHRDILTRPVPFKKFPRQEVADAELENGLKYSFITESHTFSTEGATLRVVHTPGHTDDHIALYLEEEQAIFSGDCVLGEGTCVFEDLYTYMKSLHILLAYNSRVMYPGHGPVITDPKQHITHYIQHRTTRENQILAVLSSSHSPLTVAEIREHIYVDTPPHLHTAAEGNVRHHLTKLEKEHRVGKKVNEETEQETWVIIEGSKI